MGKDFSVMRFKHSNKTYPPRVKMTVAMKYPETFLKLPIKITGCSNECQLDTELIFPLGTSFSSLSTTSRNSGRQQTNNICEFMIT